MLLRTAHIPLCMPFASTHAPLCVHAWTAVQPMFMPLVFGLFCHAQFRRPQCFVLCVCLPCPCVKGGFNGSEQLLRNRIKNCSVFCMHACGARSPPILLQIGRWVCLVAYFVAEGGQRCLCLSQAGIPAQCRRSNGEYVRARTERFLMTLVMFFGITVFWICSLWRCVREGRVSLSPTTP